MEGNYKDINRQSWNTRVETHVQSDFYNVEAFLNGWSSLKEIEVQLLGDVTNLSILHLQCHFGQDSISLARLGAKVTGVDLSDKAIAKAKELNTQAATDAEFICCDIYDLPLFCDEQFDIVFTTYGTIGWLPDMNKWASVIAQFLKPGGKFIFVEFHPVVWMYDDNFEKIAYNYFNEGAILEQESGTYADRNAPIAQQYVMWNHGIAEVLTAVINNGLSVSVFNEFDYSPYNCFKETVEFELGKFRIKHFGNRIPMVYSLVAVKNKV